MQLYTVHVHSTLTNGPLSMGGWGLYTSSTSSMLISVPPKILISTLKMSTPRMSTLRMIYFGIYQIRAAVSLVALCN